MRSFQPGGPESRVRFTGKSRHAKAVLIAGFGMILLVRRVPGRDEQHLLEPKTVCSGPRDLDVAAVDRVKRSAEDRNAHLFSAAFSAASPAAA